MLANGRPIAILQNSLNSMGGAEYFTLKLGQILKAAGHRVVLTTTDRTNWLRVMRVFGIRRTDILGRELLAPPFVRLPTGYASLVETTMRDICMAPILRDCLTFANYPSFIPLPFMNIAYFHSPPVSDEMVNWWYAHRSKGLARKLYSYPGVLAIELLKAFTRAVDHKPLIVANSFFTAEQIEKALRIKPLILYPPVETQRLDGQSSEWKRDNTIVMIGRMGMSKGFHAVGRLASLVHNAKFVIMGTVQEPNDYAEIVKSIRRYDVDHRVMLIPDATEATKRYWLRRSKIYLHLREEEPFGISVVEGMTMGLVPVVHKSGGPWMDIVSRGRYGFGFTDFDELRSLLTLLLEDERLWNEHSRLARRRASCFGQDIFRDHVLEILRDPRQWP
jgi:glycosyltransferase involved in cell wall biosynthesis